MSSCTECGTELDPLDTICSTCGAVRDDSRRNESELGESSAVDTAPLQTDTRQIRLLLIVVLGFFTILNFVAYPLVDNASGYEADILVSLWASALIVQLALLASWCVFAPIRCFHRLLWCVATGTLWFGAFVVGFVRVKCRYSDTIPLHALEELFLIAASLPLRVMTAQAPLWCVRIWFHWRIEKRDATVGLPDKSLLEHRPLLILDVMMVTAAVAVALALAKLGNIKPYQSDAEHLEGLLIFAGVMMVIATLSVLPCIWIGLRRPTIKGGVAILALIHAGLVFAVLMLADVIDGEPPPGEAWWFTYLATGTYFTIVMVVLRACRGCGYTLRWKNE